MSKLVFVDMTLAVSAEPPTGPRPANELALISTGEQLVDAQPRRYYATPPPLRLILILRADCRIEDMLPGRLLSALIGWDEGDGEHVLRHGVGKRHTKLTVDRVLDMNDNLPDDPVTALTTIIARVPRSDRAGGARSDDLGRPPIDEAGNAEAHNVTLPARMWRRIEDVGQGNRSAGVRALVERAFPEETPMQLPYELKRALRAFPGSTAAAAEINGMAAVIVKTTKADAQSAHRPGVPVAFRSELGLYPTAAVVRLALEIHDRPDDPLKLDTFLDPAKSLDYKLLRRLTSQDTLDLHIFDEQISYQYTKRIPFRELPRRELSDLLDAALAHYETILPAARNWQKARDEMMEDRP